MTVEKIIEIVKAKWQIFGVAALTIFIFQLLSSKILLAIFIGLIVTAFIPTETVKKVTKKVTK